jgi:hypothetical protein
MSKLEIETNRHNTISGLNDTNKLELEVFRDTKISGEQTNLTIQKLSDSTFTVYLSEPQSIIIQKRNDVTETVYV